MTCKTQAPAGKFVDISYVVPHHPTAFKIYEVN